MDQVTVDELGALLEELSALCEARGISAAGFVDTIAGEGMLIVGARTD